MKKVVCVCDICKKEVDPELERFVVTFSGYSNWLDSGLCESSEPKDLCPECYNALMDIMFPKQSLPKVKAVANSNECKESKDPTKAIEPGEEYIAIEEACKIFNLSKSHVYGILKSSGVPATKIGNRMLYLKHQVLLCKECYDENKRETDKNEKDKRDAVKDLYLKGWSYAQIANKLGLARSTVGYYVKGLKLSGCVKPEPKAVNPDNNYPSAMRTHTTVDEYGIVQSIEYEDVY